jgi:heme exporter protein A
MNLLEAGNVHLWRGEQHVLRGLSIGLGAGQCLQLTGANGAGKSSLLRVLSGLLPMHEGSLRWRGIDVTRRALPLQRECAFLGHRSGLKAELSALENLRYLCGVRRDCTTMEIDSVLNRTGLDASAHRRPMRELSVGQQRRVALARVVVQSAALWLLDEPAANLDSAGQSLVHELLSDHLLAGGLAIVATHQPLMVDDSCLQRLELAA